MDPFRSGDTTGAAGGVYVLAATTGADRTAGGADARVTTGFALVCAFAGG
jgi:hypothetical protein